MIAQNHHQSLNLAACISEAIFNLQITSQVLQELCVANVSTQGHADYADIRKRVVEEVMAYRKDALPVTFNVFETLEEFFQEYNSLDFQTWTHQSSTIHREARLFKEKTLSCAELHRRTLFNLRVAAKIIQDAIERSQHEVVDLETDVDQKRAQEQEGAERKRKWALAVSFVPLVNLALAPLLLDWATSGSESNVKPASSRKKEEELVRSYVLIEGLKSSLETFANTMTQISSYFSDLESTLTTLTTTDSQSAPYHYNRLKEMSRGFGPNASEDAAKRMTEVSMALDFDFEFDGAGLPQPWRAIPATV
ncbi:hypothetical protein HK102_013563 [Quaeritorhiza haematococci]|nr:hypothetical protein HK102_013563 [Quaeritorhiza haematococci]